VKLIDGLWWPDSDVRARPAIVSECRQALPVVLPLVKEKRVCVQAGGNVGVYPLALAEHFEWVLTFEPERENIACLRRNLNVDNVAMSRAALGAEPGTCAMTAAETDNCGTHKVIAGDSVEVCTIDGLGLDACDLIWLDIEGAEADAIKGAMATIEKFSPIIVLEEKGHGPKAVLPGYSVKTRIGNDTVYWRK
jgi:FkbM family methyltransferase